MESSSKRYKLDLYRKACRPPLSQAKLAELIGKNTNTVFDWEKNGVVRVEALLQLAQLFKEFGVLSNYDEALQFWEDCRRDPYPPLPELRALFDAVEPQSQDVEALPDSQVRGTPVEAAAPAPELHLLPTPSVAQPTTLHHWSPRRWLIFITSAVLVLLSGVVLWYTQPSIARGVSTAVGLKPEARCAGQLEEMAWYWDQGGSDESSCNIQRDTIIIVAGRDTVQDIQQPQRRTAPLLLHPVHGDFTVSTRLVYDPGFIKCRHAGIGLRVPSDDMTWLRVTKTSNSFMIISEGVVNGRTRGSLLPEEEFPVVTDSVVYLRIQRLGTTVSTSSSIDGRQWLPHTTFEDVPLSEMTEIFLVNYSACNAPRQVATFSEVVLTQP